MSTIQTEEAARRLAQAILNDIALYNEEKILTGESVAEEMAEGVALFRSRVAPALHHVWDQCIVSEWTPMVAKRRAGQADVIDRFAARVIPERTHPAPTASPTPATSSSLNSNLVWMAFGVMGLSGVLAWYLLQP